MALLQTKLKSMQKEMNKLSQKLKDSIWTERYKNIDNSYIKKF